LTTPPEPPDPWAPREGGSRWEQPPGTPPPPPPGWQPQAPPGWGTPPGQPPMPPPGYPVAPPQSWPQQGTPGDWSAPGYGQWTPQRNNGMGTAALVLGIVGLLLFWTVIGGIVLGILALIFGFLGRGRVKRREADNGGAATAGIVLGALALVAGIVFTLVVVLAVAEDQEKYEECLARGVAQPICQQRHDPPDP